MTTVVHLPSAEHRLHDQQRRAIGWVVALVVLSLASAPPGWIRMVVTVGAGIVGIIVPVGRGRERPGDARTWFAAMSLGIAAFLLARGFVLLPPDPIGALGMGLIVVAAVAEEAFFRRLAFSWLRRWGDLPAIAITAVLFAAVHAHAYGVVAFPVDLGAGLIFGWQRWATGSWIAPAVTHAVANLLQVL